MKKIYFFLQIIICFLTVFPKLSQGQDYTSLTATFNTYESRCAATGSISVRTTGGSGSYKYKTTGPVNSNFTTSDSITGLSAGIYTVIINDLITNCTFTQNNIVVPGSYQDPRFTLTGINVSCDNGSNGSIDVNNQQFGRSPFLYSIVAPSPMAVGTRNNTGKFINLSAGDYSIRMTDSCGGIQTRSISINNYTWWIDSYAFSKVSCDSASGFIKVIDSRGNVSTLGSIPGFMYGVVRHPGDTVWSANASFSFNLAGVLSVNVLAKDGCGKIKKGAATLNFNTSVGATVNIKNKTCGSFSASLNNLINFFNAEYCLYDSTNIKVSCNATGIFHNIPYGRYCIKAHNLCPDTIFTRCFTVAPPAISVGKTLKINNKKCSTFSAAVTGQLGLTDPIYCLVDTAENEIACNSKGIFNDIAYGRYCIKIKDSCRDTTIIRCIAVSKPTPIVSAVISPSYINCKNISVVVGGDSLFSPQYCLYNAGGALIKCNATGIFDSLPSGNHCVKIYAPCYDTTISRCFTVGTPVIVNDLAVAISNKNCSTFTVKSSSNNLKNAQYCLYNDADILIGCDSTGIFKSIPYGNYCLKVRNDCPDTLFKNCFLVLRPKPSASNNVNISNKTCSSFTAKITGQQNLTHPEYCILDSNNVQLYCNSTGVFNNLSYGSYCIKIINTCFDTTIDRCFNTSPLPVKITATSSKSCSYGYATFGIVVSGGSLPINIEVYKPDKSLLLNKHYNTNSINIDSIPGAIPGETYKIIAVDNCGNVDSVNAGAIASIATHSASVFARCPSAGWLNGSGKIQLNTSTNMGIFTVRIIKKDNVILTPQLTPDVVVGGVITYNDLGAGTYIISYKLNDLCNRYLYDTVTIDPYYYPNLNRSSAYQCDVSGFSVGAVATNGVSPFTYEIIGSTPSLPSIIAPPQANPVFNVNNNTNYSLIRLRALDACGNATLGDASILPLANYKINVDSNCFQSSSTLSADTFYNSTYAWYKKVNYNSIDSTYLGSGYKIFVPFLSASDTGTYICHVIVNTGCVKRSSVFNLNGLCYHILPVKLTTFTGKFIGAPVLLNWKVAHEEDLRSYSIERQNSNNTFSEIGRVLSVTHSNDPKEYNFVDTDPGPGKNYYRLKLLYGDNSFTYSKIILLTKGREQQQIHCYPNPVSNTFMIDFGISLKHPYQIKLSNLLGQQVWGTTFKSGSTSTILRVQRPSHVRKGIYILQCIDINTKEEFTEKVIFL